jgi:hypothetical protein
MRSIGGPSVAGTWGKLPQLLPPPPLCVVLDGMIGKSQRGSSHCRQLEMTVFFVPIIIALMLHLWKQSYLLMPSSHL